MTNSFYVKIDADKDHPDPAGLAHKVARRNGFHNLGPVSDSCFTSSFKVHSPKVFLLTIFFESTAP
jgi:hypothetical protein